MSALTRSEEDALRVAAETVREMGPRFADVMRQATEALRPYAWASAAFVVTEEDDAHERQRDESGAGWLLDMLSTMRSLLDEVDAVLAEPHDQMIAWRQAKDIGGH